MTYEGGYVYTKVDLVRTQRHEHTKTLEAPISHASIDAINAVQQTAWRINQWVLDVMLASWADGLNLGGLEITETMPVPERLSDNVWFYMTDEMKKAHRLERRKAHDKNAHDKGVTQSVVDTLTIAKQFRNRDRFWFPYSMDFRHRIYPIACRGPHPQGDDIGKSLLMFAEGRELGPDGLFWLMVRAANCAGKDKLSLEDRVQWTMDHSALITECGASNPLSPSCSAFWTMAEEPWSFLATCRELQQAWSSPKVEDFVSHLPVPMDGSCNGLQHLAAMGSDPTGATATNLRSGPRQDIYQMVADRVEAAVLADVGAGVDEARAWQGKITRKVVKRAVMTTPYGVTKRGIRDQLINDGHVVDMEGVGTGKAADYLRDQIVEALSNTVTSAKEIMAWMQETAKRLAMAGIALTWTTPTGSHVRQGYHATTGRKVKTLEGEIWLLENKADATLDGRKQELASAPNIIHSFDAAHLALTVNAGAERGIGSWAMIHDSYATHACHTTKLAAILRQQFVDIYKTNWLERLFEEVKAYAPHVAINPPPVRGTFNVEEVLNAEFFFS